MSTTEIEIPATAAPLGRTDSVHNWILGRDAVDKHQSMWFAAGRTIDILDILDMGDSWSIREVTLPADLLVELPNPARVCFFQDGSSFQGPLDLERT